MNFNLHMHACMYCTQQLAVNFYIDCNECTIKCMQLANNSSLFQPTKITNISIQWHPSVNNSGEQPLMITVWEAIKTSQSIDYVNLYFTKSHVCDVMCTILYIQSHFVTIKVQRICIWWLTRLATLILSINGLILHWTI